MGEAGKTKGGALKQDQFFRRMQAVADLRYDDSADEEAYRSALARIDECDGAVLRYAQENGYHSTMVNDAIARWAYEFRCRLQAARARLQEGFATIGGARDTMRSLRDDFSQNVASELLTPEEESLRESSKGQMVVVPAGGHYMYTPSECYFETLEVQRRTEREDYCKGLLDQLNDQVGQHGSSVQETATKQGTAWSEHFPATPEKPSRPAPADQSAGGAVAADGHSGAAPDGPGGPAAPQGGPAPGFDLAAEGFQRPGLPQQAPDSAVVDDLDGVDLVGRPINMTVTPNGLVGGYVPPSAVNASDPRWDPTYRMPTSVRQVSAATAGALGAGLLGPGRSLPSARSVLGGRVAGAPGRASGIGGTLPAGGKATSVGTGAPASAPGGQPMMAPIAAGVPVSGAAEERQKADGRRSDNGENPEEEDQEKEVVPLPYFDSEPKAEPVWDPAHGPGSADDGVEFSFDLEEWEL
ncbi:hypothetical protein [Pauljensenia hongkongensis]|uniref:Uncharacterized protein n=1 Tax=Pauljensenia hongkongensis TaxID=178339 RepID=A0A1D8B0E0_9ACTO|nr:hypothetical protein [Pauljensenia hongkongensis]AOS46615.1 hypothetical protein BH719_00855 [Pauljensenia hongkongensis]EFW10853.1 hypothetical protein HMPREF9005_0184 [Actinomyces sp. oral taxon 178 str. F0338]